METVATFLLGFGLGGLIIFMLYMLIDIAITSFREREWSTTCLFSLIVITIIGLLLTIYA